MSRLAAVCVCVCVRVGSSHWPVDESFVYLKSQILHSRGAYELDKIDRHPPLMFLKICSETDLVYNPFQSWIELSQGVQSS